MSNNSLLKEMNACIEGRTWADAQESYLEAWETCQRGDWMLWAAQKLGVDLRKLTSAKVECVRTIDNLLKDERSINALKVAQDFAEYRATREQLDVAAAAAAAAADDAYAYADAADAAYAAADAAYAAYAAADASDADDAAYAAYAAYAAAYAAYADAAYAAYADAYAGDADAYYDALKIFAEIVRKHISFDDLRI